MKLFSKITLIVGGCLCGAGLLISISALAVAGFQYDNFIAEDEKLNEKPYQTAAADLKQLTINTKNRRINVILTDEANIRIICRGTDDQLAQVQESSTVDADGKRSYRLDFLPRERLVFFGIQLWQNDAIDLYLPRSFKNDLTLATTNAKIDTAPLSLDGALTITTSNSALRTEKLQAGSIKLTTSNGSIEARELHSPGSVELSSTNGRLELEQASGSDIRLNTSNARVDLKSSSAENNLRIKTSSGRVACTDVTAGSISLNSTNGAMELENIAANDTLNASTTNGRITVSRIAGANIGLQNTNGAVEGTIKGLQREYNIITYTTNAKNNLPNQIIDATNQILDVKTSNGKIELSFVEE